MRADRLVATLLVLQARGTATAAEIAEELEISERTTRRDLEALAMSGVPVYSKPGRGGGWSLIGGARTDLTGLSASEARALFLVAGPSSRATPELKAALRKLVGALPEPFRAPAEAAADAVIIDSRGWGQAVPEPPPDSEYRAPLEQALVEGRQVRLGYAGLNRPARERVVHPWGLVDKRGVWYLVAGTDQGRRTFRLSRVRSVESLDAPSERPPDFDLDREWQIIDREIDERRAGLTVEALVDPDSIGLLRSVLGGTIRVDEGGLIEGRVRVWVRARSIEAAAGQLAGFGRSVEVMAPIEVRRDLAEIGAQLAALYPRV